MTTTDPKLIERIARALYEEDDVWASAFPWPNCEGLGATEAYRRLAAAILPIVAAAINEAAQKERAEVAVTLRNLPKPIRDAMWEACEDYFISDQTTVDGMRLALGAVAAAIERGEHLPSPPAIEAKEPTHDHNRP